MGNVILTTVKESLGLSESHIAFDSEIIIHINSAISTLTQLGVGPKDGFLVSGYAETWADFIGTSNKLNNVKSYLFMRVKVLFDPPDTGFVMTHLKEAIKEEEWRLMVTADPPIPEETPEGGDEV